MSEWIFAATVLKLFLSFCVIVTYFRLNRKYHESPTPIDLIGNFIIGGIIGGMIYNHQLPMLYFLLLLITAIILIVLLNWFSSRFIPLRHIILNQSMPIIVRGEWQLEVLKAENSAFDLMAFTAAARQQGIYSLAEIEYAQIEHNGSLTLIKKGEGIPNVLLLQNGQIIAHHLAFIGRDEDWLKAQLKKHGWDDLEALYLVEWVNEKTLFVLSQDQRRQNIEIQ